MVRLRRVSIQHNLEKSEKVSTSYSNMETPNEQESRNVLKKMLFDISCLAILGIPLLLLSTVGVPYRRGFFCDDETIRYPYKDSTVPNYVLYIVGLCFPTIVMLLVERNNNISTNMRSIIIMNREIPGWTYHVYRVVGVFGFGALCSQLITDIAKYTIGRLRPHFFNLCDPNIDCADPIYRNKYIEDYSCKSFNYKRIRDARLSFPSGHSSFSSYAMVYLCIYIQCRIKGRAPNLIKHVAQMVCICMFWGTALSRIVDNKHHWSDVTAGLVIGISSAFVTAFFVSDLFGKRLSLRKSASPARRTNESTSSLPPDNVVVEL